MPLRILWLSHFVPYPPRGGALQRSYQLLRYAAAHHSVRVLALNQRALLPRPADVATALEALRGLGARIDAFEMPTGGSRWRWAAMAAASPLRRTPYDVNWMRSADYTRAVAAALAQESFDVVHVDTIGLLPHLPPGWWSRAALNHHNIESQMLARRAERETGVVMRAYCRRDAAKLERMERRVCPDVGVNLVVSALDGARLGELSPGAKVAVVENGVDTGYFRQEGMEEGDPRHLVFAGSMGWYPNDDAMVYFLREAWPGLVAADPGYRLTIVGHSPTPRLLDLAAADARVTVTGSVPDVRPLVAPAGVYICPIRDGGGTRLKVLDAFAMGKPLVATTLSVEGLDVEEGRHFLRADSADTFVRQVLSLRDAPGLRRSLAEAGRRLVVERYDWEAIGSRLDAGYQRIPGRSP